MGKKMRNNISNTQEKEKRIKNNPKDLKSPGNTPSTVSPLGETAPVVSLTAELQVPWTTLSKLN